jgi:hypothetical protein
MQRTLSWINPTKYTDGSDIDLADFSKIKIHIFKDGQEVYVATQGYSTWPIEVQPGVTNAWQLVAELNGNESAKSASFSYTEPFRVPMAPIIGSIT